MRTLILLLLISACVFAQESPTRDGRANRDPDANSSAPKTYQGCVIRSSGSIVLADPAGKEYKLTSRSGRQIDTYVGQEVQIIASDVNPADPSSGERSVTAGQPKNGPVALDVEQIEKVADHCSSPK
jgi:hypothetical protein